MRERTAIKEHPNTELVPEKQALRYAHRRDTKAYSAKSPFPTIQAGGSLDARVPKDNASCVTALRQSFRPVEKIGTHRSACLDGEVGEHLVDDDKALLCELEVPRGIFVVKLLRSSLAIRYRL